MPFESAIVRSILQYINGLNYGRAEKVQGSSSASGRADINACYRGRSLRIEVKTPDHKNKASAKQNHNLNKWKSAGAITMVAYSKLSVMTLLKYVDTNQTGKWFFPEDNGCMSWIEIPSLKSMD